MEQAKGYALLSVVSAKVTSKINLSSYSKMTGSVFIEKCKIMIQASLDICVIEPLQEDQCSRYEKSLSECFWQHR